MTQEKKQRVQDLAHQISEMIQNLDDDYTLLDAIDAVAIVEATLLNQIRPSAKKAVADGTLATIKSLVK
jgi:hypothetical protein